MRYFVSHGSAEAGTVQQGDPVRSLGNRKADHSYDEERYHYVLLTYFTCNEQGMHATSAVQGANLLSRTGAAAASQPHARHRDQTARRNSLIRSLIEFIEMNQLV